MSTTAVEAPTRVEVPSRIAFGVKVLDSLTPGWEATIDPDTIAVNSSTDCVACRATGIPKFGHAREKLGLDYNESRHAGFVVKDWRTESYEDLSQVWSDYVRAVKG